jgi:putative hydrolase of HD superfamily
MMDAELETVLRLYKRALPLKELPRTGWIMEGAARADSDSVAAHSYSVALLSYLVAKQLSGRFGPIKWERVLAMAVLHDLAESVTGELATGFKRRIAAIPGRESLVEDLENEVFAFLLDGVQGSDEFLALVREFNECKSKEAKIVKFADILDAFAHARIRLHRSFDRYLSISRKKLEGDASAQDGSIGDHLAKWLDAVREGWDSVEPRPIG